MQQWREVKSRHRDALVFFRVGDFYELFFGDAEEGSRLLGLTLTSRNNGAAARVPLAGVPVKALDDYLGRLVGMGRRVAICEQVEDPAEAKGIVKREVVETLTPGTIVQDHLLQAKRSNLLVALCPGEVGEVGAATLDLSTGEVESFRVDPDGLDAELGRLEPSELLVPRSAAEAWEEDPWWVSASVPRTVREDWLFDPATAREEIQRSYRVQSLEGFGFLPEERVLVQAVGAVLAYVTEIRPRGVEHLRAPKILRSGSFMVLDEMTRRNLELVESLRPGDSATLLRVLDETCTAMGARLLRKWILRPLLQEERIWERQEAVEELFVASELRGALREGLGTVSDLQRLAGKVGTGRVGPRDLLGLNRSIRALPPLAGRGEEVESGLLAELLGRMDLLEDLEELLESALSPDAPATLQEGGVIRSGFDPELDEVREVRDGAQDFIASLQTRERERTGITSLKVGFNKVFGYYLEVTRPNLDRVPEDFVRKQTLVGAERFFTPELKEWEEKVFGAQDRILTLETVLFGRVRDVVMKEVHRIQDTAARLARIDVLAALAEVARDRGYVRPQVHTAFELQIVQGRHPVVETVMPTEEFIPNDLSLNEEGRIVILTGPNMAGKSTVLRQVGLIQLLGQMGAFVPAASARLPVCDRIFTRVGASDSLARGQSTFMVEMNETAAIIHGGTERSLILLDEIGRGTSTYDGVSIAWAVTEYLHERVGAKTIFATHYHEMTQLGDLLPGVVNLNVAVRESGEDIVFLRRLEEGGADRSYGIQVARLAGFPPEVLARARELLFELEGTHSGGGEGLGRSGSHRPASEAPPHQLSLFGVEHPLIARIRDLELEEVTPLEALNLLASFTRQVRGESRAEQSGDGTEEGEGEDG
jgi:DNA mismatch repair protein MutS